MKFIINCIKGIALGAGAILPGISSGVLCVVFGIYEKLIDSILNFFKDIKGNSKFLFPLVLGVGLGIILFGNILKFLFNTYPLQTNFTFIGLVLGSIPILLKQANSKKGFRLHYLIYLFSSFLLTILSLKIEMSINQSFYTMEYNFIYLIFCGFCMSVGVVVPGVSSTVILTILGVYQTYLDAVASLNIYILFPMGIGLLIGGIIFLKIIQKLLKNYFVQTYYVIIGFVISSVFVLYPGITFDLNGYFSIIFLILGFKIATIFEK